MTSPDEPARPGVRWETPASGPSPEAPRGDAAAGGGATPPSGFPTPGPTPGPWARPGTTGPPTSPGWQPGPAAGPPGAPRPFPGAPGPAPTWWGPAPPPPARPPRSPEERRRRRRVVLLVLGAVLGVAVVVVALLAFLVGPRFARYDVLDAGAVARGVTGVVTTDWKRQITDTRCPDDQRVAPGTTFTCTATVDGRPQQVPVTVTDTTGAYEVGQPR